MNVVELHQDIHVRGSALRCFDHVLKCDFDLLVAQFGERKYGGSGECECGSEDGCDCGVCHVVALNPALSRYL
jgi:hypothetical protein